MGVTIAAGLMPVQSWQSQSVASQAGHPTVQWISSDVPSGETTPRYVPSGMSVPKDVCDGLLGSAIQAGFEDSFTRPSV